MTPSSSCALLARRPGVYGCTGSASEGRAAAAPIFQRAPLSQAPVMTAGTKPEFVIEKLTREHGLSGFDCANATLNDWLRKFAWTNQQADSAKTFVALNGNRVVGYYALTTGSVHRHESLQRICQGLRQR